VVGDRMRPRTHGPGEEEAGEMAMGSASPTGAAVTEPARPFRFAQLGLNNPHAAGWRDCLERTPGMELVAFCETDPAAAQAARLSAAQQALPVFGDLETLVREARPDAVLITLPNDETAAAMRAAAEAGLHVFAEKPCARSAAELQPAAAAIRRAGVQFGTGYLRRYSPIGAAIKEMVDTGLLGRLVSIEARWIATSVTRRGPSHYVFKRERSGGGMLHWLGCHWLDFMRWTTGSEVTSVAAIMETRSDEPIDVEDVAAVALGYDNGMVGSLHVAYVTDESADQLYFGLRGTLGWVRWERSGPEVELHSAHPAWATAPTRTLRVAGAQNAGYGDGQGQAALRNFVAAARGEAQPVFTVDDALRILEVLDAAQRSSASGERVRLG